MTVFRSISVLFIALCLAAIPATAEITLVPEKDLAPEAKHVRSTKIIRHLIESFHYQPRELDDDLSSSILDHYLENLDPNRSYFLENDIQSFQVYRDKLDNALKDGNLAPAFHIFKVYRNRVDERINYALDLLKKDFSFDVDEDYRFDRRDDPWPANKTELDEIWRKRVKNDVLNLRLAKKEKDDYISTLEKRYQRIRTSTFQLNSNDIYQSFINSYTTAIEPHTAYFSPRVSENFDISMRLSLEGIGAVLTSDNDYTVIQRIIPGGPADLSSQLHDKDKIVGVGQGKSGEIVDVIGWRLDDVVELIRGPKDTVLRLEIIPNKLGTDGPNKIITLTRDKIKLEEQAAKSEIITVPDTDTKIGVIDVPTFYIDFAAQSRGDKNYKSTTHDVQKLIADLKKENISGLIIDLRGNGGGSLSEALEFTGLFIDKGPVVQTRDSTGKIEVSGDNDPGIAYDGPLVVLVDRNSASASEIFAGAIQDYQRGVIIGEPTFGKGTVQSIMDLNRHVRNTKVDHGKLKATIAQFFRISGDSNQFKGIVPDIIYPTADTADDYGERSFDNALPSAQIKAAKFSKVNAFDTDFSTILENHRNRIGSDRAFQLLMEEIDLSRKLSENKTVTLLESRRKKEQDELEATRRNLQNEMRIAQGLDPIPVDADLEEINEDEVQDTSDILLNETANILNDIININTTAEFRSVQQTENSGLGSSL